MTARHHNAVGNIDNLINMLHPGFILYLRNDADRGACLLQNSADSQHIVGLLHKGGSDIIHIVLHGKKNIRLVLLGQEGQLQLNTRTGYTLA